MLELAFLHHRALQFSVLSDRQTESGLSQSSDGFRMGKEYITSVLWSLNSSNHDESDVLVDEAADATAHLRGFAPRVNVQRSADPNLYTPDDFSARRSLFFTKRVFAKLFTCSSLVCDVHASRTRQ